MNSNVGVDVGVGWCDSPALANRMVVSKSPRMPAMVAAASMQACVPRDPACSADSTAITYANKHNISI